MKTKRNLNDRKSRIIARGEVSGHAHIVTGDCEIYEENNEVFIKVTGKDCAIKHLLEQEFVMAGMQTWTKEHDDIDLGSLPAQVRHGDVMLDRIDKNTYKYIQQIEYNPYEKEIQKVRD